MEDEGDIQGPLVFSCLACRTIVGDTLSLASTNPDLQSVTLTGASNILRQDDLITSKSGADKGSTFFVIECQTCHKSLGKYYITTPRNLDEVREKFTLLIDHISSYELGKVQHGSILDPTALSQFAQASKPSPSKQAVAQEELPPPPAPLPVANTPAGPTTEELEEELGKVQHVIMDLLYRVAELEKAAADSNRAAAAAADMAARSSSYHSYRPPDHHMDPRQLHNYPPPPQPAPVPSRGQHHTSPQSSQPPFSFLAKRKEYNSNNSQEVDNPILAKRAKPNSNSNSGR